MKSAPGSGQIDYLVVGHITRDITPNGERLGGTAAYASLLASRLGWRVGLVTAVSGDVSLSALEGIDIYSLPTRHTTTFVNSYHSEGREQEIRQVASPLKGTDIPEVWRRAGIVHLAPVVHEIDPDLMVKFQRSFVGLSLQGWLRDWDDRGRVSPAPGNVPLSACRKASAVVFSYEDVGKDPEVVQHFSSLCPLLIATRGPQGADLFTHGERTHIPTTPRQEVDPTGAGDIFAAAFFIHYQQHGNERDAAHFATSIAALSVTGQGLDGVPTRKELQTLQGVI